MLSCWGGKTYLTHAAAFEPMPRVTRSGSHESTQESWYRRRLERGGVREIGFPPPAGKHLHPSSPRRTPANVVVPVKATSSRRTRPTIPIFIFAAGACITPSSVTNS